MVFPLPKDPSSLIAWVWAHPQIIIPLFFSLWMGWTDVRTHRIPNLLSLFCALSGLGYQMGARGWPGLGDGFLGLFLGFGLMIPFYLFAGMGAGDVKAVAALGTWLGFWNTFLLFILLGLSGLPIAILFLWYRGQLFNKIYQLWSMLLNLVLIRSKDAASPNKFSPVPEERIPYAVAIALGMVLLCLFRAAAKNTSY
jgi:prepilin peptidase CpaA